MFENQQDPAAIVTLATELVAAGELRHALDLLERHPDLVAADAEASLMAGVLCLHESQYEAAVSAFERATQLSPASARAWRNRAVALSGLGHTEEALADLDCALGLNPTDAEVPFQKGNILLQLGQAAEALACYHQGLQLRPDHSEAFCNLGNACQELGRFREAVDCYDAAIELQPSNVVAWANRGNALQSAGRIADALASYEHCLALRSDDPVTLSNFGVALQRLGHVDGALTAYACALELAPHSVETWVNLGKAQHEAGLLQDAITSYRQALANEPDHGDARYNLGLALLAQGDYAAGWQAYEARWRSSHRPRPIPGARWPEWQGEPRPGMALLVTAEQGHGDLIQFARFVPLLIAQGAAVTLLAPKGMHRLLAPVASSCRLIDRIGPNEAFDAQIALMSLPARLRLDADALGSAAYLKAEPALAARWADWLGSSGLRIGIAWQGNPAYAADSRRSIPLLAFERLAGISGVRLISLQRQNGLEQVAALTPGRLETPEPALDAGEDAFVDTAALMASLDLVITSDTAIAHLAGALGRPVWLALARVPDWRWGLGGGDTPWYPTMRLFRQSRKGDWAGVFDRIAVELVALRQPQPATDLVHIPISPGELTDKISILEIKLDRITDPEKRRSVGLEHELLVQTRRVQVPARAAISDATAALKQVNETLWDLENEIRLCEGKGQFDARFVEFARAIYKTNDRRADLKRQINALCGSIITEVKSYAA